MREHETHGGTAHTERTDAEIGYGILLKLGFGLLALVLVAAALMYFLYGGFLQWERSREPEPPVLQEARARAPVPGAQLLPVRDATGRAGVTPEQNLAQYEAQAEKRLTSYGWVDEGREIAHVPIARAIEIVASRGLDVGAPSASTDPEAAATEAPAEATDAGSPEGGGTE